MIIIVVANNIFATKIIFFIIFVVDTILSYLKQQTFSITVGNVFFIANLQIVPTTKIITKITVVVKNYFEFVTKIIIFIIFVVFSKSKKIIFF